MSALRSTTNMIAERWCTSLGYFGGPTLKPLVFLGTLGKKCWRRLGFSSSSPPLSSPNAHAHFSKKKALEPDRVKVRGSGFLHGPAQVKNIVFSWGTVPNPSSINHLRRLAFCPRCCPSAPAHRVRWMRLRSLSSPAERASGGTELTCL